MQTDYVQVPCVGIGHCEIAARLKALHLEHQPLVAAEAADIAFASCQRAVDDTYNFVRLARFRVERIIGVRTLQHNYLIGVILVVVAESTHLLFGYDAHGRPFTLFFFAFILHAAIEGMFFDKMHQCMLRGEYKHDARKQRFLLFIAVVMHMNCGMGRRIDFKDILGLRLLLFQKLHQLALLMTFGTHDVPTVIHMIEFVGHNIEGVKEV